MLGFYEGSRITVMGKTTTVFAPRWLHESYSERAPCGRVERFATFMDFCRARRPAKIVLYRTYALGDILMLLPVARALRRTLGLSEPISIVVQARHIDNLKPLACDEFVFLRKRTMFDDYGGDVHYCLDSCLEADHRGGPASDMHRIALYGHALGLEITPG